MTEAQQYPTGPTLAIIPVRGGSQRVANKNRRHVCGRTLLDWTLDAALEARQVDHVVVTTDSSALADIARARGALVVDRPPELATDTSPARLAEQHALATVHLEPGIIVRLQATSPLRTAADVDGAIGLIHAGAASVVSCHLATDHPFVLHYKDNSGHLRPMMDDRAWQAPSQQWPEVFRLNGAIMAARRDWWVRHEGHYLVSGHTMPYVVPRAHGLDIDTLEDLELADHYMHERLVRIPQEG